jgi:hypothetical protein
MIMRKDAVFSRFWDADRGPYGLLVMTLLSAFVITPLVVRGSLDPLIVDAFFVFFMFAGVVTVRPGPLVRYLILVLAVLPVLMRILSGIVPHSTIIIGDSLIELTAVGIFALLATKQFLMSGRIPAHRIGGAIVVYLLIGILWSRLYYIADMTIPGAFRTSEGAATLTSYVYFSFVTLATIGYGDISPVHPLVRNLAVLEAVTGQMYIAVLIARLVSASTPSDKQT